MPSKHRVSVSLSPEEHHALESLSVKSRVSQAWIARQALAEFLARHLDDQMQLPFELAKPEQGATAGVSPNAAAQRASRRPA